MFVIERQKLNNIINRYKTKKIIRMIEKNKNKKTFLKIIL